MDRQFFAYLRSSVEVNGFMRFLMCQVSERKEEMMLKLGKLSGAVVLGCLLCLALFSTGAFAQSASYNVANNAAQGVTAHVWQGAKVAVQNQKVSGWGHGHARFTRFIRVTRMMRVTRMIRVTRTIREARMIRVTRMIHVTQFRRISACGGGC